MGDWRVKRPRHQWIFVSVTFTGYGLDQSFVLEACDVRIGLAVLVVLGAGCQTAPAVVPSAGPAIQQDNPRLYVDDVEGFAPTAYLAPFGTKPIHGRLWVVGPSSMSIGTFVEAALERGAQGGCDVLADAGAFELDGSAAVGGLAPADTLVLSFPRDPSTALVAWRFVCVNAAKAEVDAMGATMNEGAPLTASSAVWGHVHAVCRLERPTGSNISRTICMNRRNGTVIGNASQGYVTGLGATHTKAGRFGGLTIDTNTLSSLPNTDYRVSDHL